MHVTDAKRIFLQAMAAVEKPINVSFWEISAAPGLEEKTRNGELEGSGQLSNNQFAIAFQRILSRQETRRLHKRREMDYSRLPAWTSKANSRRARLAFRHKTMENVSLETNIELTFCWGLSTLF